jgi:hypothetical protein
MSEQERKIVERVNGYAIPLKQKVVAIMHMTWLSKNVRNRIINALKGD